MAGRRINTSKADSMNATSAERSVLYPHFTDAESDLLNQLPDWGKMLMHFSEKHCPQWLFFSRLHSAKDEVGMKEGKGIDNAFHNHTSHAWQFSELREYSG